MSRAILFLKGLLMGAADIVPGVSGGTMALITGIYDRFITGLSDLGAAARDVLRGKIKEAMRTVDWSLFVPLGLGIVTAFALGSVLIPPLIQSYPGAVFSFFVGLILASAWYVFRQIRRHRLQEAAWGLVGLAAGIAIAASPFFETEPAAWLVGLLGMLAVSAMLLPGISGSYILLMFGQYEYILESLRHLRPVVLLFVAGMVAGLLGFSRILRHLLRKHHSQTFAALTGIMVGALYRPGSIALENATWIAAGTFVLGILAVIAVEALAHRKP